MSFRRSQIQAQLLRLCISNVLLRSGYWNSLPYKHTTWILRWNDVEGRFHVVSTWNPCDVFVGFLLHCPNHHFARKTLFHKINQVSGIISRQSNSTITKILLFGDNKLDFETSKILLMSTIKFIPLTERFSCPLFV